MLIIAQGREASKGQFSILFSMIVYCLFSLESPHRGDSNEYKQYTIFNINTESHPKLSKYAVMRLFPGDLRTSSKQPW